MLIKESEMFTINVVFDRVPWKRTNPKPEGARFKERNEEMHPIFPHTELRLTEEQFNRLGRPDVINVELEGVG